MKSKSQRQAEDTVLGETEAIIRRGEHKRRAPQRDEHRPSGARMESLPRKVNVMTTDPRADSPIKKLQRKEESLLKMLQDSIEKEAQGLEGATELRTALEREYVDVKAEYMRRLDETASGGPSGHTIPQGQSLAGAIGVSSDVSLSGLVRGLGTGNWRGMRSDVRALMSSGAAASIPGYVTAGIVDLARESSVIFRAGAALMPIDSPSAKVARMTSEPAVEFLPESAERDLTDGQWGFDAAVLDACSAWLYTTLTIEAIEDCVDLDAAIQRSFAAQLALAFDEAALVGDGADQPVGIALMSNSEDRIIEADNAVGTVADYVPFVQAMGLVKAAHHEPSSIFMSPSLWTQLACLQDGDLNPLQTPRAYSKMSEYVTSYLDAVPLAEPATTTAIVGDFSKLTVGVRTDLTIEVSRTAGDAFKKGAVAVRGYVRFGTYLTDPTAFALLRGITVPAAEEESGY